MKNKNRITLRFALIAVVAAAAMLLGLVVYYDSLVVNLQTASCKTLDEVMQQEQNSFTNSLSADKEALKGYAQLLTMSAHDQESLMETLDAIVQTTFYEYTFFAQPGGDALNNTGESSYVGDRDYFNAAMAGETVISDPIPSRIRDANIIAVATPVWVNGEITGALIGTFNTEKLNEMFLSSFDGYGYTYVATNDGQVIARTISDATLATSGNLFELYDKADFYKNDSYETMRQNLVEGRGGHSQYLFDGQQRLLHYGKLSINDWNIFSAVNPKGVTVTANQILSNAIFLAAGLGFTFLILLIYNFYNQKRFTRELTNIAYVDNITGYSSFGKFKIDAQELLCSHGDVFYMLIKMDIDNFKLINEIYSLETGDQVLKNMARSLALALDEKLDAFGRVHADEFIVLLSYRTMDDVEKKRLRFESQFAESCEHLISFKIILPRGLYKLKPGETDFGQIYERVNFAHRMAKTSDHTILEYDERLQERAVRKKEIENKMEDALLAGEFQMYLQPKYRLLDEKMVGAEALARWISRGQPVVFPNDFIPIFEQNGFVTKLDFYMFQQACKILQHWVDIGIEPVTLSVNFSRRHLSNEHFVEELTALADAYSVPYHLLEIELTETAMLDNLDTLETVLLSLHKVGFTLSMDDFGTGYSSLGLLKNIPVDVIKIDKAFFDQSKDPERAKTVISSVLEMTRRLEMTTVAEGVETQAHIDLLRELGCDTVQGYYYAKPMPAQELEAQMARMAQTP